MKMRLWWLRLLGIWCWIFGHTTIAPGHWELGWFSERKFLNGDDGWHAHFSVCECTLCKAVIDSTEK